MNPNVLLAVALISMLLNVYYMGRVWTLKKLCEIYASCEKASSTIGFRYYAMYMRSKLGIDMPETHLAKSYNSILVDEVARYWKAPRSHVCRIGQLTIGPGGHTLEG